jgi:hypothetical protein
LLLRLLLLLILLFLRLLQRLRLLFLRKTETGGGIDHEVVSFFDGNRQVVLPSTTTGNWWGATSFTSGGWRWRSPHKCG